MTDREAPSKDQTEEATQPALNHPAPRLFSRKESAAEIGKWTWKKFFEHGLSHAGVILWEWDINTGVLRIDSLANGHPFYYECSSPTTWDKVVHKDDLDRLLEALRRFEETSCSSLDCVFRLATKFTRWVHARDMHLFLDSNERPAKVWGLFFDATESELAKNHLFWGRKPPNRDDGDKVRSLRMASERLRHEKDASRISALRDQCYHEFMSLFSFSDLPAFRKNTNLDTTEINPAMARLLGITSNEIVRRTDHEIWGHEAGIRLQKLCGHVLLGETVVANSTRSINGTEMEFLDQFYPEWGSNGRVIGICGIMSPTPTNLILDVESPHESDQVSATVRAVYTKVQLAARHDCNVLLTGESGTGKDYLARQIHDLSKRADGPFENFNCAALQKELAGSELFGHEAGAFTGAKAMRKGIFELAAKGTVFLNEIGDMPLDLQPRLLTILETRSFRRVGGEKMVPLGARIIAATNADLNKEGHEGHFRKDLYHRLTVFTIRVPPLRDRLGELPGLVENLTQKIASDMGLETVPIIDSLAMRKLRQYPWPGNIRELRNVLERAFIHSQGPFIGPEHIVFELEDTVEARTSPNQAIRPELETPLSQIGEERKSDGRPQKPSQQEIRQLYQQYIVENGWTRARLADRLGVHSSTLKKWFKAAGLEAGKRGRPRKGP